MDTGLIRKRASEICEILYHSSMGDGWEPFIINRGRKICDLIISVLEKEKSPKKEIDIWEKVKQEIASMHNNKDSVKSVL